MTVSCIDSFVVFEGLLRNKRLADVAEAADSWQTGAFLRFRQIDSVPILIEVLLKLNFPQTLQGKSCGYSSLCIFQRLFGVNLLVLLFLDCSQRGA